MSLSLYLSLSLSISLSNVFIFSNSLSLFASSLLLLLLVALASIVFTIGAIVMGLAPSYSILIVGRLIIGVGIGLASLSTPIYIAEVAKPSLRGQLVGLNSLFIPFGQFVSGMVAGLLSDVPEGWRYMLGLAALPSAVMFVGFLYLPESPRWLVSNGRMHEATRVLKKLRDSEEQAEEEVDEIVSALIAAETVNAYVYISRGTYLYSSFAAKH
jgi:SP family myo-inositol transporter-like MFS transporter 13